MLRRNHDDRFVRLIEQSSFTAYETFINYGGCETLENYGLKQTSSIQHIAEFIRQEFMDHIEFLKSTRWYYEDKHYIYVHAGLNPVFKNWRDQPKEDFFTIREVFLNQNTVVNKLVVFGHTKTRDIYGLDAIWFSSDKIGIDGDAHMAIN
ncbi:serine/threonine protein phosphatase [Virgibacillus sp. JSM 102003]|uniref:serine/threonine protein phosphatase n=1 Tax=Virgibacillus sp. JSM 102003 TaxID=1562108 RepID=UPI0035C08FD7